MPVACSLVIKSDKKTAFMMVLYATAIRMLDAYLSREN
jgi:hypothetical protein